MREILVGVENKNLIRFRLLEVFIGKVKKLKAFFFFISLSFISNALVGLIIRKKKAFAAFLKKIIGSS